MGYEITLKIINPKPYTKNYGFLSPSFPAPILIDGKFFSCIQDYINLEIKLKNNPFISWMDPPLVPTEIYEKAYYNYLRTYPGYIGFIKDYGLTIDLVDLQKIVKKVEDSEKKSIPIKEPYDEKITKKWMRRLNEIVKVECVERPDIKMLKDYIKQHFPQLKKYLSFIKQYPLGKIFKEDPELVGKIETIKSLLKIKWPVMTNDGVALNEISRWLALLGCLDPPKFKKYLPPNKKRKYRLSYAIKKLENPKILEESEEIIAKDSVNVVNEVSEENGVSVENDINLENIPKESEKMEENIDSEKMEEKNESEDEDVEENKGVDKEKKKDEEDSEPLSEPESEEDIDTGEFDDFIVDSSEDEEPEK